MPLLRGFSNTTLVAIPMIVARIYNKNLTQTDIHPSDVQQFVAVIPPVK
jgi:hypothetical protein